MHSTFAGLLRVNRNFRFITLAFAISLLGDWFSTIAVFSLLGGEPQHQASLIGWVLIVKQLPLFFFSLPAGVVADRFSRRAIMIFTDVGRAAVVLGILLYPAIGAPIYLYLLLTVQAALSAFFEPARSALTPDLVEAKDLVSANALHSMLWSLMLVCGAALGGVVTEFFGWQAAIVLDAGSYLLSAVFIRRIELPSGALRLALGAAGSPSSWGEVLAFTRYLCATPQTLALCLLKAVYGVGGAMILLLTVFGQQVYSLGEKGALGVSVLYIARGVGALCGPFIARAICRGEQPRMRKLIYYALLFLGVSYACFGLSRHLIEAALCVALAHMLGSTIWVLSTILLQLNVPSEIRGKAFGIELGLFTLSFSCSTLLYGWLIDAHYLDARQACVFLGLSWFLSAAWWLYSQKHWRIERFPKVMAASGEDFRGLVRRRRSHPEGK